MNAPESISLFISFCEKCVPAGLTIIIQTTLIIAVGLLIRHFLRKRNAALQSTILRATLVIVILSPPVSILYVHYGINKIQVPVPVVTDTVAQRDNGRSTKSVDTAGEKDSAYLRSSVRESEKDALRTSSEYRGKVSQHPQPQLKNKPLPDNEQRAQAGRDAHIPQNTGFVPRVISDDSGGFPFHFPRIARDITTVLYCILIAAWIVSSVYYLLKTIIVSLCIVYIRHTGFPAKELYLRICEETASMLGMRVPSIIQHPVVRGTFVCGYIKPAIVLPYGKKEHLMATREVVLHEYAHLARHDTLWNLVCQFVLILLPVQPLISTLLKKVNEVNDYACDDYVLAFGGNRRSYATQLFNISKTYSAGIPEAAVGSGILSSTSPLYDRIDRILDTSYIGIIKVRAFEIVSVVIFSFSSLTLTGFVGFRGESTNGKRLLLPPERQHIERIITHVPEYKLRQSTIDSDTLLKTQKHVENSMDIPHKIGKSKDMSTIIADTGAIDSQINSESDETHIAASVQHPHLTDAEKVIEIPDSIKDPAIETENIADSTFQTDKVNKYIEQTGENSADTILAEPENNTAITEDSETSNISSFSSNNLVLQASAFSNGEFAESFPRAVEVIIPQKFENADRSDPVGKKMIDIYRSVKRNKQYPVWSPDGKWIAFTDVDYGIWMVSAQGGEPKVVYESYYNIDYKNKKLNLGDLETLCFTPDGNEITFRRFYCDETKGTVVELDYNDGIPRYDIENPIPVIESVNIHTGESRVLVDNAFSGNWSYDGRYFAYIYKVSVFYNGVAVLDTATDEWWDTGIKRATEVLFTPDDEYLIVNIREKDTSQKLIKVPFHGGEPVLLAYDKEGDISDCSSDGEWILISEPMENGMKQIVYNTGTTTSMELFPEADFDAYWGKFSPDGTKILFNLREKNRDKAEFEMYIHHINYESQKIHEPSDSVNRTPVNFTLNKNFPNPFNLSTTMEFSLPEHGHTTLVIYNSNGQRVRELISDTLKPGIHHVQWDGRNDFGNRVSSGIYLSRLYFGNSVLTGKMSLVK